MAISISDSIINPTCYGGNSGSISVTVSGGTNPYNYLWSNNSTNQNLTNVGAGSDTLTVTDTNNCTALSTYNISNPPPSMVIIDTTLISANNTGIINITVSGGLLPYSYHWSNNATTEDLSELANGTYIVTVTDINSCIAFDTIIINIPELPLIIPSVITPNKDGKNDTWQILGIEQFNHVNIVIFNRWGDVVYKYDGSTIGYLDVEKQWDGTFSKHELPTGSYIYIIDFDYGTAKYNGIVSIIR